MRELKFREWSAKRKKYNQISMINLDYYNADEDWDIEQYTGLKDINGKIEAYENDQFITNVNMVPDGISSAHNVSFWISVKCTIVFKDGRFLGKYELNNHSEGKYNFTSRSGYIKIPKLFEITGNIHEAKK